MQLAKASIVLFAATSLLAAVAKTPAKPAPTVKTPVRNKAAKAVPRRKAPRAPVYSWRNRQTAPTKDRYREIQQALYEQGYLAAEPTGNWNPESVEALRRFQTDQNLSVTGRISALTLINLGLGPNHSLPQVAVTGGQN